ncbi:aldehyde dehydrogenase (NADP(+)) [Burkholderia oklahomensis]|uniref:aldehyde dehydrogenase (NADP(+)) n=1 Tax=Burkholderia oklahomensis TaxID=342113 RepID=UPI00016A970C|nr:aldehyde dehydrogenase (NADP(+)) [Burkholderia oklahomensis]AJX33457.1 aldehyde dehydrogenase family protein [Burkholderia oklahomensis C6786]AOI47486.1 2,5-dioxovalerate dehydrogenase [Burkholderia oklahomensis C6786]KUY61746.1 2,5-dioxovalerate dehydrogenase [Burkholderia oklahomensis C6786]MBI0359789.1 aldehyde dehydrogenase (NADP(+)) [Burkholderia oklahomensis]SUW59174.1 NADP-dependent fatty aldehyde dehydrogenase [Burkholderia oklahomensis]
MSLSGELMLGGERVAPGERTVRAIDPATGATLGPAFALASRADVARACELADAAFDAYRDAAPDARAALLDAIAAEIEAIGDALIERAIAETALPRARLEGERARTCNQLRLFASVVRAGDAVGARIDPALPERKPLPRADLRMRRIALGPVAVFGASNFPLAFSVAGGDTASALAAGCPVVVKAHPAHPGTSELVGRAVAAALARCGLPAGVFSLVQADNDAAGALVADPRIQAVGFTGSRAGGQALLRIVQSRARPIPMYGELSAINPVFLLPDALETRGGALGRQFVASLTLGAGQFCTNPGLLLAIDGPGVDAFANAAADALETSAAQPMLTPGIHAAYVRGVERLSSAADVRCIARGDASDLPNRGRAGFFETGAQHFIAQSALHDEIFGATALLVRCRDAAELRAVAEALDGQLTATLHLDAGDAPLARALLPVLERKAGRIVANGWPTGVEVCDAMVHGGPWPATTDARATSVGTAAIERFLRPVCYQDLPAELLPPALRDDNPLRLRRLIDGNWV